MKKKRTNKKYIRNSIILVTSAVFLNILGVSYATWNNSLQITNWLSTGKIAPLFGENFEIENVQGDGNLDISFDDEYTTMTIQGVVTPDYKGFLHYTLRNDGDLPVKFIGENEQINNDTKLILNQQAGIIKPQDSLCNLNGDPKLQINTSPEGSYNFQFELVFRQWNDNQEPSIEVIE